MIYSSGRESYFNLNSTWYDPSGSWLDTRRTPFRYGYANCCSSGCQGEGVEGMRGHDYRHYGYRQPRCSERCHGYSGSSGSCHGCVRRPTYSYGASGGCQGYGRSVCSERCQGSSGSCHGGGSSCVRRPTVSYGGSGGCQGYGRSVCAERCHGSGAQGGKPCCGKPMQSIPVQSCPQPVQSCPQPVQSCPPPVQSCPPPVQSIPVQSCPPPVQSCPPPVQSLQSCPCPCPPPIQQGCVPVAKGIPRQQQKQICKVPARKIK
ncbi:keratin-associated protein 5-3-like [Cinclus cinclus]|uniref:keratin-associated protein 5-3-like n=1 Tax=Cinclus cinclus TaxID=127875 RepID=UPI002E152795